MNTWWLTVQGLSCTLTQSQLSLDSKEELVQILHVRNNHWIVISSLLHGSGKIDVFDSVYFNADQSTEALIASMLNQPVEGNTFCSVPKQKKVWVAGL